MKVMNTPNVTYGLILLAQATEGVWLCCARCAKYSLNVKHHIRETH